MRCDVNVSIRPDSQQELGVKIELKNMNSVSAVRRALHYEISRQIRVVKDGGELVQSTRRWDDDIGETQQMRTKEDAHDYRYFPDPDLLPVKTEEIIKKMSLQVPELPHQKAERFVRDFSVSQYDASVLSSDRDLALYFEESANESDAKKKVANWVINNVLAVLNERDLKVAQCPVSPSKLALIIKLVESGKISNNQAKEIFAVLFDNPDKNPQDIITELGFEPADSTLIESIVEEVIINNPEKVKEIQEGNEKLINWLTGQVMKASEGKANPKIIGDLLREKIL